MLYLILALRLVCGYHHIREIFWLHKLCSELNLQTISIHQNMESLSYKTAVYVTIYFQILLLSTILDMICRVRIVE